VVFELDDTRFVAGGWQPALAYDVLLANLDPTLRRKPPPETPEPLLEFFPYGLTTAEVAAIVAEGPDYVADLGHAEHALLQLVADGVAERVSVGQDAVWRSIAEPGREEARTTAATAVA
jgi:hypothetical protein